MRSRDVILAYALLTGRQPETEAVVQEKAQQDIERLVSGFLASAEFEEKVISKVLDRAMLKGGLYDASPDEDLLIWAADVLGLLPESRNTVRSAASWYALYAALFHDPVFSRIAARAQHLLASRDFLTNLKSVVGEPQRSVIGRVTEYDGHSLKGWVANTLDPEEPLEINVILNGGLIETLACITDPLGRATFSTELSLGDCPDGAWLDVREAESGLRLARYEYTTNRDSLSKRLALVEAEILRAEAEVSGLKARQATLRTMSSFPLADYNAYWTASQGLVKEDLPPIGGPRILVLLSGSETGPAHVSLRGQSYRHWQAADLDAVSQDEVARLIAEVDAVVFAEGRGALAASALGQIAGALSRFPASKLVYADDDIINVAGEHTSPRLKPDFDIEWLRQENYIGSFVAMTADLAETVLGEGGRLDHDALLKVVERVREDQVRHIPKVLYHSLAETGVLHDPRSAAGASLRRLNLPARVSEQASLRESTARISWGGLDGLSASIIICTRDGGDFLKPCIDSLLATAGANQVRSEIIVVDNGSVQPGFLAYLNEIDRDPRIAVLRDPRAFNWAELNTAAAARAKGDILVFLNDDTRIASPDWCDELCGHAIRPDVGAVGPRLLYPDGTIQQAGTLIAADEGLTVHDGVGLSSAEEGYLGRHSVVRQVSTLTGACLATRRRLFLDLDGFDPRFAITNNDVDYCLRLRSRGLKVLFDPYCTVIHLESASRGSDADLANRERAYQERLMLEERWGPALRRDPFYNPHFERFARPFSRLRYPPSAD